jgi:hypothetical protein
VVRITQDTPADGIEFTLVVGGGGTVLPWDFGNVSECGDLGDEHANGFWVEPKQNPKVFAYVNGPA